MPFVDVIRNNDDSNQNNNRYLKEGSSKRATLSRYRNSMLIVLWCFVGANQDEKFGSKRPRYDLRVRK